MNIKERQAQDRDERMVELGFAVGDRVRCDKWDIECTVVGCRSQGGERGYTIHVVDDDGDEHNFQPHQLVKVHDE